MIFVKKLFLGAAVSMMLAMFSLQASAGPVYSFSFGSAGSEVSGRITGLPSFDDTFAAADSVFVDLSPVGALVFAGAGPLTFFNQFDVFGGNVTAANFLVATVSDTEIYGLDLCFGVICGLPDSVGYGQLVVLQEGEQGLEAIELLSEGIPEFQQVPVPATLVLLGLGLVGLRMRRIKS
ncbi:PEP-CTERM sorting domain-containing protein [Congregibacter brevis]|uniref:PEP-CTERM sorting domain-containing protein n=1 Tax=Congregibacter brevis TaxID=3081201 RepID=A0ABZ0IDQ9_9GAMM|nr:PEP-CTERM sorting domain-containing protein [Congregibacter sp. IMCC45268]